MGLLTLRKVDIIMILMNDYRRVVSPISLDVLVSDFRCSKVGIKDLHSRVTVDEQLVGKYKCALSHCTVPLHHVLALCYLVVF